MQPRLGNNTKQSKGSQRHQRPMLQDANRTRQPYSSTTHTQCFQTWRRMKWDRITQKSCVDSVDHCLQPITRSMTVFLPPTSMQSITAEDTVAQPYLCMDHTGLATNPAYGNLPDVTHHRRWTMMPHSSIDAPMVQREQRRQELVQARSSLVRLTSEDLQTHNWESAATSPLANSGTNVSEVINTGWRLWSCCVSACR